MDFSGDVELTWIFFAQFMLDEPAVLKDIFYFLKMYNI